jgi:hypothetical protein
MIAYSTAGPCREYWQRLSLAKRCRPFGGTVRLTGLGCSVAWCGGQTGFVDVTLSSLYKGHRYPVEILSHCAWLYHRFPLSLREIEELMMARGNSSLSPPRSTRRSSQPPGSPTTLTMPSWARVTTTADQHCVTLSYSRRTALTSRTVSIIHISALPGVELLHCVRAEAKSIVIMVSLTNAVGVVVAAPLARWSPPRESSGSPRAASRIGRARPRNARSSRRRAGRSRCHRRSRRTAWVG